jgi:NAD(P)-dependent dehydrogenase (short-subunit alcohol dehydrogenase family)
VLAHAAAIQRAPLPEDLTTENIDQMMAANVRSTIPINQTAFEHMRQTGGGSIVNWGRSSRVLVAGDE